MFEPTIPNPQCNQKMRECNQQNANLPAIERKKICKQVLSDCKDIELQHKLEKKLQDKSFEVSNLEEKQYLLLNTKPFYHNYGITSNRLIERHTLGINDKQLTKPYPAEKLYIDCNEPEPRIILQVKKPKSKKSWFMIYFKFAIDDIIKKFKKLKEKNPEFKVRDQVLIIKGKQYSGLISPIIIDDQTKYQLDPAKNYFTIDQFDTVKKQTKLNDKNTCKFLLGKYEETRFAPFLGQKRKLSPSQDVNKMAVPLV